MSQFVQGSPITWSTSNQSNIMAIRYKRCPEVLYEYHAPEIPIHGIRAPPESAVTAMRPAKGCAHRLSAFTPAWAALPAGREAAGDRGYARDSVVQSKVP